MKKAWIVGKMLVNQDLTSFFLKKKLLASTKTKNKVKGRFLLDVVVGQGPAVLKLLSSKDQPLLIRWNTLLVLKGVENALIIKF